MDPDDRRSPVVAGFARLFGDRATEPDGWVEQAWAAEPWSGGGPVAVAPVGALTAGRGALREPVGRVHWAGTETSAIWGGYIDGAIRSGQLVAAEVLGRL